MCNVKLFLDEDLEKAFNEQVKCDIHSIGEEECCLLDDNLSTNDGEKVCNILENGSEQKDFVIFLNYFGVELLVDLLLGDFLKQMNKCRKVVFIVRRRCRILGGVTKCSIESLISHLMTLSTDVMGRISSRFKNGEFKVESLPDLESSECVDDFLPNEKFRSVLENAHCVIIKVNKCVSDSKFQGDFLYRFLYGHKNINIKEIPWISLRLCISDSHDHNDDSVSVVSLSQGAIELLK